MSSDFQVSPELLAIYLEDARQHLEALDHCLLALERDGVDAEVIGQVLGPLHTLKGNSGMIGFGAIKDYVHRLEDVFARMTAGTLHPSPEAFDALFAGATALRDAVEQASLGQGERRDLGGATGVLDRMLSPRRRGGESVGSKKREPAPVPASATPAAAIPESSAPADVAQYAGARSNMVRVDFSQLDHMLNLVGELIIHRTKLQQLGKQMAERLGGGEAGRELAAAVHQVAAVSAALQETVMDVRMLPIRHVFERFPRLVRDLARQTGKDIELILEGSLEYEVEGRPPVRVKAGDVLFIPARTIHAAKNIGSTNGAELATYIVEKGKPLITLVK